MSDLLTDIDALAEVGADTDRQHARAKVASARRRERTRQSKLTAKLAVIAVLCGFLVAFVSDEAEFSAEAFGEVVSGDVEVYDSDTNRWSTAGVGDEIPFNRVVRTLALGPAKIRVRTGDITLAPDSEGRVLPGQVKLNRGAVLFEVSAFYLGISPELIARGDGAWKLETLPRNPRVGIYTGTASAVGGELIQQLGVAAQTLRKYEEIRLDRDVLSEVAPLRYQLSDPWDARLAADLLAIDDVVDRTARGIGVTYGDDERPEDFYTAFTVVDEGVEEALAQFDTLPGAGFGPPADVLVAVIIARLIAQRGGITFEEATLEVDEQRSRGATWGIILVRRDLGADDFVGALDLSLREIANLGEAAPSPAPPSPAPSASPTPSPTPSPTDDPTVEPTQEPTPEPTEEPTEDPGPVPTACDGTAPNAPECVNDLVDELLKTIDELIPPMPRLRSLGAFLGRMLVGSVGTHR